MPSITTVFENGDQVMLTNNTSVGGTVMSQRVDGPSGARFITCLVAIKDSNGDLELVPIPQHLLSAAS